MTTNNLVSLQYVLGECERGTFMPTGKSIDHILTASTSVKMFTRCIIEDECNIMTSDHLPIIFSFNAAPVLRPDPPSRINIAWNKCNDDHFKNYQAILESELYCILATDCSKCCPDFLNKILIDAVHNASKVLPLSRFNKRAKPYWCEEIKNAHT